MNSQNINFATKEQVDHLEKEQVDIKADMKIMQHDISAIKETMATKTDLANLRTNIVVDIANLRTDLTNVKYDIVKWIFPMFIAIILTILFKK
jgi:hypothetical protein